MRRSALLVTALLMLTQAAAHAASGPFPASPDRATSSLIEPAAVNCGPFAHYVPAHRVGGRLVLGHCRYRPGYPHHHHHHYRHHHRHHHHHHVRPVRPPPPPR